MNRRFSLFLSALFVENTLAAGASPCMTPPPAPPRSAPYPTAHALLSLPLQQDSSDIMTWQDGHARTLLWTGDGEAVERWNELFAGRHEVGTVRATVEGSKEHFFLSYSDCKLQAPVRHDRDDELVVVLTLNRLVKEVTELRFCIDSQHAGDLAFLALPPAEWAALQAEFGAPALAHRFMPLPDTAEGFWPRLRQAADEARARRYGHAA